MTECGNCSKPIDDGEPILVTEWHVLYKGGKKKFLGRETLHAEGHGCMVDEGKINYPQNALPVEGMPKDEKSKERLCLEQLMEMLCGNNRIVLQSDFLLPYDLTVQKLGSDHDNWGKVIEQEHTHSSREIDGCDEESIEIVTDSFINHILGKGGLSWNIDKESPDIKR